MEPSHRWGGWRIAAPAALLGALVLGVLVVSCTGPGSGEDAAVRTGIGPSRADLEALSDPTTTLEPTTSTSSTLPPATTPTAPDVTGAPGRGGGSGSPDGTGASDTGADGADGGGGGTRPAPLGAADCAALEQLVIPAAAIITEADFVPLDERPPATGSGNVLGAAQRVAAIVPAAQRPAWQGVVADVTRAAEGRRRPSAEERARLQSARNGVEVWARAVCPGAPPSWRCDSFGSIGPGPDVAPTRAEAASPEAVLRRSPDAETAVELQRTDDIVLFGWVTAAGFVTRTHQVERIDEGWATGRVHTCHSAP